MPGFCAFNFQCIVIFTKTTFLVQETSCICLGCFIPSATWEKFTHSVAALHNNPFPTNKGRTRPMTLLAVGWASQRDRQKKRIWFAKKLDIGMG